MPTDYIGFLREYKSLCEKYGIEVTGCGCCGSPYLFEGKPDIFHLLTGVSLVDPDEIEKSEGVQEGQLEYCEREEEIKDKYVNKILCLPVSSQGL